MGMLTADGEKEPLHFQALSEKSRPQRASWFSIAV